MFQPDLSSGRKCRPQNLLLATLFLTAALLWSPRPATAHPHAWIDITVQVLFDAAGDVTGLRENWLLDEFYTAFALEGIAGGKAPSQADIDGLMKTNMQNLAEYSYFTKVSIDGEEIAFAPPKELLTQLNEGRLLMSFVLPFKEAAPLTGKTLSYGIYDPTYYIEVLHAQQDDAIRLDGAPAGCDFRKIPPRPSLEDIARAASLDQTQTGGDGLGKLFSERVLVSCP